MGIGSFRTTTFSAVFSNAFAEINVRNCRAHDNAVFLTLPNASDPTKQHYFNLGDERNSREKSTLHGIVRCHDYQTVEAIQSRARDQYNVVLQLLLRGFDWDWHPTCIYTIHVILDLPAYVIRGSRIPSMAWARRMWAVASRADMLAFTGVYYSVLGGAYSSLGKEKSFYAAKAGYLALRQIKLAQCLRDPILECKCWLYYAEDLIQLRRFKKADKIIARQNAFATHLQDTILLTMVQSVRDKREQGFQAMLAENNENKA